MRHDHLLVVLLAPSACRPPVEPRNSGEPKVRHRRHWGVGPLQILLALGASATVQPLLGQDVPQPMPNTAAYFDFWEGTRYQVVNGRPDTSGTRFVVRRGVHPASWEEVWRLRIDSATAIHAHAIRSWDATKNRWRYVWVSEAGHFQVWEGRESEGEWYFYRPFEFPADQYLSRQAWLPIGPGRVRRVSEKSYDQGATWEPRFQEEYVRAGDGGG